MLVIEECSSQDRARSTLVLEVKVYQELSIRQWIVTTKSYVNQVDRTFTRKSQEQELHVSSRPFLLPIQANTVFQSSKNALDGLCY